MTLDNPTAAIEYLMGRRFEFADKTAPDVTITGGDVKRRTVRAHGADGSRAHLAIADVVRAVESGAWVESETGLPFVLEREAGGKGKGRQPVGSLRTGVAGTGKALLRLVPSTGRWEKF